MPIINPTLPADGDDAVVEPYNTAIQAVLAVLNGSVDADNLAALAVTTGKLADLAVTNAKIEDKTIDLAAKTQVWTGWVSITDTWTYASYDSTNKTGVVTVPSDATGKYSAGMRVKFTNNSAVQYGIITDVSATSLTIYFGTDYSLTSGAITSPAYSVEKAPLGFPLNPEKWTVTTTHTTTLTKTTPTSNVWYGGTNFDSGTGPSISLPIGSWNVAYEAPLYSIWSGHGQLIYSTLSTTASSESDPDFSTYGENSGGSVSYTARKSKFLTVAIPTTYYLNIMTGTGGVGVSIKLLSALAHTRITAVCAYL